MSTDKSLKHLKSKDTFLIANVSNYSRNTQVGTAHHIFTDCSGNWGQQKNRFPSTKRAGVSTQKQSSGLVAYENSTYRKLALAVCGPFMA